MRYNIVRNYFKGGKRIIERNVTLEEAQEHCGNLTATGAAARARTKRMGKWFDGYEKA